MKLEVGQIWQVPKTLDVRMIVHMISMVETEIYYINLFRPQEDTTFLSRWLLPVNQVRHNSFLRWIRRKDVKLIGHYDFKKRKATPKK